MHKKKYLLLLPIVAALSSCGGYSLDYIVEGDKYLSSVFTKNFYEHWDGELTNAKHVKETNVAESRITSFKQLGSLDPNYATTDPNTLSQRDYSNAHHLSNYDDMFNYGVQSKLFDGKYVCDGVHQQQLRMQIGEKGFSVRFSKESDTLSYFAMNFKATTNNQIKCYKPYSDEISEGDRDKFHNSELDLTVTIYVKEESYIVGYDFTSHVNFNECYCNSDVISDPIPSQKTTNDGSKYYFYGFDLSKATNTKGEKLSRMIGFSVSLKNIKDDLILNNEGKTIDDKPVEKIDYALFIYEVFLPYTYWH